MAQAETVWASVGSLAEELGPSAVAELVDDFALQTPELISKLESMIGVPACQTSLRRLAHSLKGSSSIFGLAGVERASFQLERSALDQDIGPQPGLIAELTRQFQRTLPILNAVRHRLLAEGD
jgi:HPt (histidine-containing phosphotransfer) domain-containing protein